MTMTTMMMMTMTILKITWSIGFNDAPFALKLNLIYALIIVVINIVLIASAGKCDDAACSILLIYAIILYLTHTHTHTYYIRYVTNVVTSSWGLSVTKIRCPVCQDHIPQSEWSKFVPKSVVDQYNRFNQPYRSFSRCCPGCETEVMPCQRLQRRYVWCMCVCVCVLPWWRCRVKEEEGAHGGSSFVYSTTNPTITTIVNPDASMDYSKNTCFNAPNTMIIHVIVCCCEIYYQSMNAKNGLAIHCWMCTSVRFMRSRSWNGTIPLLSSPLPLHSKSYALTWSLTLGESYNLFTLANSLISIGKIQKGKGWRGRWYWSHVM